jgi:predicted O-methyltransferase YrrM
MNFLPEDIEAYAEQFTAPEPSYLNQLNRFTHQHVLQPRMLAGHLQGRFISMLSKMIQPKLVLEVGTYTGYSALCWAEGLAADGKVHTIEIDDELAPKIQRFFDASPFAGRLALHVGPALEVIPKIEGPFDVVFLDADKNNYLNYLELVLPKVKVGGYIIADNVLWSGKVLENPSDMDPDTKALWEYARYVQQDERLEELLLPLRDGLLIARKNRN